MPEEQSQRNAPGKPRDLFFKYWMDLEARATVGSDPFPFFFIPILTQLAHLSPCIFVSRINLILLSSDL